MEVRVEEKVQDRSDGMELNAYHQREEAGREAHREPAK